MAENTTTDVDLNGWEPVPGFVLCKQKKREDLQTSKSGIALPDSAGKVADSVGVGEVILVGTPKTGYYKGEKYAEPDWLGGPLKPGDLVAWMPFTDSLIEINLKKYSLVPYDKIRAVKKAAK